MSSKVAILTYHSIDNSGSVISMAVDKFRFQMETLKNRSFNVISLTELVECLQKKQPLDPKTVVITFDDGFKNIYTSAYPVLSGLGYKATVFLVPGYCGKKNKWPGQPKEIPSFDLLEWDEIEEMKTHGIDFGAHTMSHPDLSKLPLAQAAQEIVEAKTMIQNKLGKNVRFFAYPYGKFNSKIKSIVEYKFYGACSTELGFVSSDSDIYNLPRIDMYYSSMSNNFIWFGGSIFWLYIIVRRILRFLRNKTFDH